jgi:hypothetical protein
MTFDRSGARTAAGRPRPVVPSMIAIDVHERPSARGITP